MAIETEASWLTSGAYFDLLWHLQQKQLLNSNNIRSFVIASCDEVWDDIPEHNRAQIEVAKRYLLGEATKVELQAAHASTVQELPAIRRFNAALPQISHEIRSNPGAWLAGLATESDLNIAPIEAVPDVLSRFIHSIGLASQYLITNNHSPQEARDLFPDYGDLIRAHFPNPFRPEPLAFDNRWRTSTVVDLAKAIYLNRDFSRLPILADALMDAGCDSDEVLNHCRSYTSQANSETPGTTISNPKIAHASWVVNSILGMS